MPVSARRAQVYTDLEDSADDDQSSDEGPPEKVTKDDLMERTVARFWAHMWFCIGIILGIAVCAAFIYMTLPQKDYKWYHHFRLLLGILFGAVIGCCCMYITNSIWKQSIRGGSGWPTTRDMVATTNFIENNNGSIEHASIVMGRNSYYEVKVDPDFLMSRWDGWGCSLAWWANSFGDREDLADALFTKKESVKVQPSSTKVPGLAFNIVRYNAGASSDRKCKNQTMQRSRNMLPKKFVEAFWTDSRSRDAASSSWDWSADAKQVKMLLMAKERGATHFELFSNSPVWWQTESKNPAGHSNSFRRIYFEGGPPAGIASGAVENNLLEEHIDNHAYYMAAIAKHAQQHWGLTFTSVEPINEPQNPIWHATGTQEGCWVSREQQNDVIMALRSELDAQGLQHMDVAASDESLVNTAIETWNQLDPDVRKIVDKVNVHGYEYQNGARGELFRAVVVNDGKKLWLSEYGEGFPDGLAMSQNIHMDLKSMRCSAWAYWQPIDDNAWGMFSMKDSLDHDEEPDMLTEPETKWWVMAHYSRHIRPGMSIISTHEEHVPAVAALDTENNKVVLVCAAYYQTTTIDFNFKQFDPIGSWQNVRVQQWTTLTDGTQRYVHSVGPTIKEKTMTVSIPRAAVITLEVIGVQAIR